MPSYLIPSVRRLRSFRALGVWRLLVVLFQHSLSPPVGVVKNLHFAAYAGVVPGMVAGIFHDIDGGGERCV